MEARLQDCPYMGCGITPTARRPPDAHWLRRSERRLVSASMLVFLRYIHTLFVLRRAPVLARSFERCFLRVPLLAVTVARTRAWVSESIKALL